MDDLRRALSSLDSVEVPDLWPEIERRATAPDPATQRGTGRFQTMFSATKFVVAGVIVALFGGFLLSGVPTQPNDERLPAVGASASTTAQPGPTDAVPTSPERSAETEADDTITSDLLPGVDLLTEEVEPGVYRVLSDGHRDLSKQVYDVTVTPGGDVWVELGSPERWDIVRLGEPEVSRTLGRKAPGKLFTVGGAPVVSDQTRAQRFDGEAWVDHEPSPCDEVSEGGQGGIAADGDCWTLLETSLGRDDRRGGWVDVTAVDLGLKPDRTIGSVAVGDDGTLWATVRSPGPDRRSRFAGLVRYDGSTWERIAPEQPAPRLADGTVRLGPDETSVGPDGTVWIVELYGRQSPGEDMAFVTFVVRTWDGDAWTTYRPVEVEMSVQRMVDALNTAFRTSDGAHVLGDGTVWFLNGQLVLEADGLRAQECPGCGDWVYGPDGHAWSVDENALYVIIPEATVARE